jgi:uncharacterized protein
MRSPAAITQAAGAIVVRRMDLSLDDVPRWWFGGSAFTTHLCNGLNFVFPAGEQFFIRSVRHFADRVDPALRARIHAFAGQEAWHQRAHTTAFTLLEAQGYEIRSFLDWYEAHAYARIEPRFSPEVRLATTAALEHYTAIFGELALGTEMLDRAHPAMAGLLKWHGAEEIEHRAVAFDVLLQVDPRWTTRLVGFVLATWSLARFWWAGARHLLAQEPRRPASDRGSRREVGAYWMRHGWRAVRRALAFLAPGFHPGRVPIDHLAATYLASIGRVDG